MNIDPFVNELRAVLPPQWSLEVRTKEVRGGESRADALLTLTAPDGSSGDLLVELKARVSGREAAMVGEDASKVDLGPGQPARVVFTRYATRMAQGRLRKAGVSYLDLTGNAWIRMASPGLYIERQGADKDPNPPRRGVQSLKGAKAARIVRSLCDRPPPVGVRELARRTGTNPGYVTRVLSFLEDEDVIRRDQTGEVAVVLWQDLLKRWSVDYSLTRTNRVMTCLAPRGLSQLQERLQGFEDRYVITGSFAVPPEAQIIPGRLLTCFVPAPESAAKRLDVRPTDAGANVLLVEPFDELVFEGQRDQGGLKMAALTQCAVDLITGSGREPTQADALMTWMSENEDVWRT